MLENMIPTVSGRKSVEMANFQFSHQISHQISKKFSSLNFCSIFDRKVGLGFSNTGNPLATVKFRKNVELANFQISHQISHQILKKFSSLNF